MTKKSDITFEQALGAFDDPYALIAPDVSGSKRSDRKWLIGQSSDRTLVVVFSQADDSEVIELVSARKANEQESELYEVFKGVPVP